MMKSQEEKNRMIEAIKAEFATLPEINAFGDSNKDACDAMVVTIENGWDEDEVYNQGYDDNIEPNAISCAKWLNGEIPDDELVNPSFLS